MSEEQTRAYGDLPKADSVRRIDFEEAQVRTLESFPPQHVLIVRGTKPYLNMRMELSPLIYVMQPEYWGIEVVGHLDGGIGLPAQAPYEVSIPLAGIMGTRGIEVIGATRSQRFDLAAPEQPPAGRCGGFRGWHDHEPPGPARLNVRGACEFPTAGFSVELRRREPQGINPKDLLLEKVVHAPIGPAATVLTKVDVEYREETDFEYDSVTILPDGFTVRVEEVH